MIKGLNENFIEYMKEINSINITNEIIEDYLTSIYYDLYDEYGSLEIEEVENNIRNELRKYL